MPQILVKYRRLQQFGRISLHYFSLWTMAAYLVLQPPAILAVKAGNLDVIDPLIFIIRRKEGANSRCLPGSVRLLCRKERKLESAINFEPVIHINMP
ncbi:hypothetical protein L2725_15255 [Shewanella corallii]|uniref:Uncharacterized protein n=1 Tax=Shewanella corallii TaxID=560080 RepID=A0ABT0N9G7_9GAMM|nr:hypothetical protein [Shewanella corallii]MCL2915117.1 hypothetical protein [Shewanella corallii]